MAQIVKHLPGKRETKFKLQYCQKKKKFKTILFFKVKEKKYIVGFCFEPKLALNLQSFCLSLPYARISGMHQAQKNTLVFNCSIFL
jgi:hypothetical protein